MNQVQSTHYTMKRKKEREKERRKEKKLKVEGLSHKRRWRDWQQMEKNGLKVEESSTQRRKSKEEKVSKLTF